MKAVKMLSKIVLKIMLVYSIFFFRWIIFITIYGAKI